MAKYLLHTNHLAKALEPGAVSRALHEALLAGHRVSTCVPVICETEVGIRQTRNRERNQLALLKLTKRLRIWPVDLSLFPIYADIRLETKSQGRHLSQIDIMIAAIARQQQAILLTADRDFDALPDLACEDWLATST